MCREMFIQGMLWQGMLGWGIQGVLGGQEFTALALSRSATVSRGEQHRRHGQPGSVPSRVDLSHPWAQPFPTVSSPEAASPP